LFELLREGVLDVVIGRIRDAHRTEDYTFKALENEALSVVVGVHHSLGEKKTVKFSALLDYPWILQPTDSPMREVLEHEFRMLQAPTPKGIIETASVLTTTHLIAETDMIGVLPKSIADTYAKHGLLKILPCLIQHKMEEFGSVIRKDRPLSEAAEYFLGALHQR